MREIMALRNEFARLMVRVVCQRTRASEQRQAASGVERRGLTRGERRRGRSVSALLKP